MVVRTTLLGLLLLLQGCAALTTYQANLGEPATGVSMDAKQRVLLVNTLPGATNKARRMCAEPSPDALAALGASVGASVVTDVNAAKQLSAALGESTASIGLRTTSIQLMRDAMYRVCEAYLSGGITEDDYRDLQAHSQTLIVGLLAIEQLTGAVKAQQVALTSSSGAGGAPDMSAETEALTQAKKDTLTAQQAADAASAAKGTADKAVTAKKAELDKANQDSAAKPEDKTKLQNDLADLQRSADSAGADVKKQSGLLAIAQQSQAIAQEAFDIARTRVRTSVSGAAKFSEVSTAKLSDDTVKAVASTVEHIVSTVVGTSLEGQACFRVLSHDMSKFSTEQRTAIVEHCNVVKETIKQRSEVEYKQQLKNLNLK